MTKAANYLPEVRQQYEEFPYPERDPKDDAKRLIVPHLARIDAVNHFCFKGRQNFNNFRALIAGGGTGDTCMLWGEQLRDKENAEVVYVDMSSASTDIAKKRAAVRKLTNIKFINDSILNLPNMDLGKFDYIDCCGVLHHLKDPDAGLKALKSVLKPGGAMSLMVYAPYGRASIYAIQDTMRLVNAAEENPRKKIKNTKAVLQSLPPYHWMNVMIKLGWGFNDFSYDAGIYDMFLHTQDRAYTILEVHDWLERCGLKMPAEPGTRYVQEEYLPETYIKDEKLLQKIKGYPLKVQQAIGEAFANKIPTHEFYAVHAHAEDTVAKLTDEDMVVWQGINKVAEYEWLASVAGEKRSAFTITMDKQLDKPKVYVADGKFIQSLLRCIDGKRTVKEVIEAVKNGPRFQDVKVNDADILKDFEALFKGLNRGYLAFLRHKSIEPFATAAEMQLRVPTK